MGRSTINLDFGGSLERVMGQQTELLIQSQPTPGGRLALVGCEMVGVVELSVLLRYLLIRLLLSRRVSGGQLG